MRKKSILLICDKMILIALTCIIYNKEVLNFASKLECKSFTLNLFFFDLKTNHDENVNFNRFKYVNSFFCYKRSKIKHFLSCFHLYALTWNYLLQLHAFYICVNLYLNFLKINSIILEKTRKFYELIFSLMNTYSKNMSHFFFAKNKNNKIIRKNCSSFFKPISKPNGKFLFVLFRIHI